MRKMILVGAAALTLAVPAVAQDTAATAEAEFSMNATQQTSYDGWPADRQAAYDAWPGGVQEYYWTLSAEQQQGWWALTDAQRVQVYEMTPAQRTAAWAQISAQLSGAAPAASASAGTAAGATAAPGMGSASASTAAMGNMRFVESETVQSAPAPKTEYPICEDGVTDGCINPREAGKNYGNVPLNYWPGRPASEIDEPLPAEDPNAD